MPVRGKSCHLHAILKSPLNDTHFKCSSQCLWSCWHGGGCGEGGSPLLREARELRLCNSGKGTIEAIVSSEWGGAHTRAQRGQLLLISLRFE